MLSPFVAGMLMWRVASAATLIPTTAASRDVSSSAVEAILRDVAASGGLSELSEHVVPSVPSGLSDVRLLIINYK